MNEKGFSTGDMLAIIIFSAWICEQITERVSMLIMQPYFSCRIEGWTEKDLLVVTSHHRREHASGEVHTWNVADTYSA